MAKLDLLGQVGRHFAVFCLFGKAPLSNLDQIGPVLFPAVFRALLKRGGGGKTYRAILGEGENTLWARPPQPVLEASMVCARLL